MFFLVRIHLISARSSRLCAARLSLKLDALRLLPSSLRCPVHSPRPGSGAPGRPETLGIVEGRLVLTVNSGRTCLSVVNIKVGTRPSGPGSGACAPTPTSTRPRVSRSRSYAVARSLLLPSCRPAAPPPRRPARATTEARGANRNARPASPPGDWQLRPGPRAPIGSRRPGDSATRRQRPCGGAGRGGAGRGKRRWDWQVRSSAPSASQA